MFHDVDTFFCRSEHQHQHDNAHGKHSSYYLSVFVDQKIRPFNTYGRRNTYGIRGKLLHIKKKGLEILTL